MNYLAHIFLSGPDADWRLGGLLGDFVKGPLNSESLTALRAQWTPELLSGIRLHRKIDAHVDHWPLYTDCVSLLGDASRRWGGVAMDVFFDHLLARHWHRFSGVALTQFSAEFYSVCDRRTQQMPERAKQFISRAREFDLLAGYADLDMYLPVMARIDRRVRFDTNLIATGQRVIDNYEALEQRFLVIMPQLIGRAEQMRQGIAAELES